ncbi:MAG: HAD-IIIA family hydrolase [Candidatus Omnitrophota bacterium]
MESKIKVSVVVLTKNEEKRIAQCLDSVRWADEIIVVDDQSTDTTLEIVRRFTNKIFIRKMDVEGIHRNWAYAQAKNLWVLSLDADEIITPDLKEEIKNVLCANPKENGFTIPRRNYIGSYWVKYGGWYPSPQLKLFQKDKFRYEEVAVHPRAFMPDPCGHLKSDLIHYSYRNLEDFLNKLNRQTTWEAQKWFNQNKPMRLGRFLWRTYDRFMRAYITKQGFKDGFMGLAAAFFAGLYQFVSYLKYCELERAFTKAVFLDRDGVINKYPGDFQYVTSWDDFHFLPNIESALKRLQLAGFRIFIISNQAGVSKGVYSQDSLNLITQNMVEALKKHDIEISGIYYCLHREADACSCRKPKAGLVHKALAEAKEKDRAIDIKKSFFVGDTIRDIETGKAVGLKTILVFSGKEKLENKNNWLVNPDFTAADLSSAVDIILKNK